MLGAPLDHYWDVPGVTLGSLRGHFGVIFESLPDDFRGTLGGHFGVTLGATSGARGGHFGGTLG